MKFKNDLTTINEKKLLIFSDNLFALNELSKEYEGKIDLVYIDPPFNTSSTFRIGKNRVSTVSCSKSDEIAYSDKRTQKEYLKFLEERLIIIKKLLSDKGSIYLHIDYKIGHYVKVLMDDIFGQKNFRNDITRIKCNPKNFKRNSYGNIKDMILFYSKTDKNIWNNIGENVPLEKSSAIYKKTNSNGKAYVTIPLHAPGESNGPTGKEWKGLLPPLGRHWRTKPENLSTWDSEGLIEWSKNGNPRKIVYLDLNKKHKIQDIWTFKDSQKPTYPTEKNLNLLTRIILNSSNENSIVLDCFSGSGSTLFAAEICKRRWIGIDESPQAIAVSKKRLTNFNYEFLNFSNVKSKNMKQTSSGINRQRAISVDLPKEFYKLIEKSTKMNDSK